MQDVRHRGPGFVSRKSSVSPSSIIIINEGWIFVWAVESGGQAVDLGVHPDGGSPVVAN